MFTRVAIRNKNGERKEFVVRQDQDGKTLYLIKKDMSFLPSKITDPNGYQWAVLERLVEEAGWWIASYVKE